MSLKKHPKWSASAQEHQSFCFGTPNLALRLEASAQEYQSFCFGTPNLALRLEASAQEDPFQNFPAVGTCDNDIVETIRPGGRRTVRRVKNNKISILNFHGFFKYFSKSCGE